MITGSACGVGDTGGNGLATGLQSAHLECMSGISGVGPNATADMLRLLVVKVLSLLSSLNFLLA